jgi:hypothetical protein
MDIRDALVKQIGEGDSEALLFKALACLVLYNLSPKKKKKQAEQYDDDEYSLEDAFADSAIHGRSKSKHVPIRMIPMPM